MDLAGWTISAIGILIAIVIALGIGRKKDQSSDEEKSHDDQPPQSA
ncbi:hypothetical protein ACQP2T_58020 [Nonomuraea sp. CA-143628]